MISQISVKHQFYNIYCLSLLEWIECTTPGRKRRPCICGTAEKGLFSLAQSVPLRSVADKRCCVTPTFFLVVTCNVILIV